MCAIVDVNNSHKIFGQPDKQTPAGRFFLGWLESENGRLIYSGSKFADEIERVGRYAEWLKTAVQKGHAHRVTPALVDLEEQKLQAFGACRSDDAHLIALARMGGARLLFTEDSDLQDDFGDPDIVTNPRGMVYSTRVNNEVSIAHRRLLDPRWRGDMCSVDCPYRGK